LASAAHAACCLLLLATTANAAPFPTRDQNPLIAGFGLPMPLPARLPQAGAWSFGSSFNWGSSSIAQAGGREALVVDAETRELRISAARGIGERFAFQLQAPYSYTGPGVLDGFINDWHELFGLPEGARPLLPEDQLLIVYERGGQRVLDERSSRSGLGNLSADLGVQLASTPQAEVSMWLSLKLPTSTLDMPGEDSTDASISVVAERRFASRWSIYGQASLTYAGEDDTLGRFQESMAWSGHAGVSVRTWRYLDLKLQMDAHTALVEGSELDYLGDVVALTFGGSYEFDAGWRLEAGISEDIWVDASPDVVFVLGVQRTLPRR
jgi:hypothetical protein